MTTANQLVHLIAWLLPSALAVAADRPFTDVTSTHVPPGPDLHALDAVMLDVDGDGDLDVAIAVENGPNALYINEGKGHLRWTPGAFNAKSADNEHVRSADFNNDGHPDLVFVAEDDKAHQLYFGDGRGGFIEHSERLPRRHQGNGLAVGDLNGDGLADIVIGNTPDREDAPVRDSLLLNDPRRPGHFIDVSTSHLPRTQAHTQGIALADMDGDGDLDMVIASEVPGNRLLLNDGKGRFRDASERMQLSVPLHSREVHVLDANVDGHNDILFFNLTSNAGAREKDPQTRLLLNDGNGHFRDHSMRLPRHDWSSWGGTVIDFDQDGAPDILIGAVQVPGFVPLQVRAWRNDGNGGFSDVTGEVIPMDTVGRSWSMATGDLDGDGRPDVFIGGWRSQARLLLTDAAALPPGRAASTPSAHQALKPVTDPGRD